MNLNIPPKIPRDKQTSINLPAVTLTWIDELAAKYHVSRNEVIVRALELVRNQAKELEAS